MKKVTLEAWKEDLEEFKQKTIQFYEGGLSKQEYKGYSGGYGSYAQKGGNASMLRLRLPGGRITKDKLKFIADCIETHGIDCVHLTTCQTIQLHNLQPLVVFDIIEKALDHKIVTRGGGGDFPRNVMVSPLSGVERGEYFDVLPYAEAAGEYLLTFIKEEKMPRKLKVAFSNSPANETHATFRDLGFAARKDGTFDVYAAGGLGNNPKMGIKVAEQIDPCKVLYYICAMRKTFLEHGNYEQRGKARTRYMQDTLGKEGVAAVFLENLKEVLETAENLDIEVDSSQIHKQGDGTTAFGSRVIGQKQEGLYAVKYHPIGGCPHPSMFRAIYDLIKDMEAAELRISPDETMYIINLTGRETSKVLELTSDGARTPFEASVSCIGASICQVGVRDSQNLLRACIHAVKEAGLKAESLPQIHISGCPSSCGTHQIGDIGFHGGVKSIDKVSHPVFTLHLSGSDKQDAERFGDKPGVILEKDIPEFIIEVGRAAEASEMSFHEWNEAYPGELKKIAARYLK